ncbi:uncharacterized protein LAESUDRAFT_231452 [Laetiporus sulphureus 93-53]|uniref:CBM1 domain-containing protein n=1 Tax=Laetiporus sulphureus 93-53 TaxID=1314785 RepID=A0A165DR35_9APHY|nr:uncharacterized protein LAESUDRAFT_231452 [Laetiporus sulphureus 93-53]KZT05448.1 hypothetical protein LAESUDRAFT_231452 [Laetiporus sulphureus 93-53]
MTTFSTFVRTALVLVFVAQKAVAYRCYCVYPDGGSANTVSEICCVQTGGEWEGPTYCNVGADFGSFSRCCTDPSEGRENYHDSCYA